MPYCKFLAVFLLSFIVATAKADDDIGVTPYRPSVSNPAQLPVAGQLELEFGGLLSKTDDMRRGNLPYQLKFAFDDEWGVLLGGDAYVRSADQGVIVHGIGDTTAVLKRAFLINEEIAFGLEFSAKMPTAKDSIGSGKADYGVNGIVSLDIDQIDIDINLNFTRLGTIDSSSSRQQWGLATAISRPLTETWGITAELSGFKYDQAASAAQFLVAGTYSPTKNMTLDFGVIRGLTSATPDWSVFAGIVIPVAKFW